MQMASASAIAVSVSASSSSGSSSPALAVSNKAHQMEVDFSLRAPQSSSYHETTAVERPSSAFANTRFVEQQLIPPNSRLSRLPNTVPSSPHTTTRSVAQAAISAFQNNNITYTSQDVHDFVNNSASRTSSTATRTFGQPSTLETNVSSSSQPLTQHVLTHPIRRPRTSNHIFQSSSDLAAHYGIPQVLPPAPRTTQYLQPPPNQPSPINDFQTLSANYLNMLSQKPAESTMAAPSTMPMMSAPTQSELEAPLIPSDPVSDTLHDLEELFASPEFRDQDFLDYMTSPMMPGMDDFLSPQETPYSEFLNTPLFNDDAMLTSPMMDWNTDMPLFGGVEEEEVPVQPKEPQPAPEPSTFDGLYILSPETPALHTFADFPAPPTSTSPTSTSTKKVPEPVRRSKATGIRKGVTPDSLLDEDAPTQPRKYVIPSATSKKDLPAVFARKRSRSTAFGEEEDQLGDDLPPNPTEKDLIEQKRRQNTVAARRSRKRKLEQFQMMEKERDEERRLKEMWKERANVLLQTIKSMGVHYENFPEDEPNMYAEV